MTVSPRAVVVHKSHRLACDPVTPFIILRGEQRLLSTSTMAQTKRNLTIFFATDARYTCFVGCHVVPPER